MKKISALLSILIVLELQAQDSAKNNLQISGYAEVYYSYDFNKPADHNRPAFFYSHNRHNEFNLNLGYLKAAYSTNQVRANLSVGLGTYMNANYAAEPGLLKNIYEANAGLKLAKTKSLWLDAGIFSSHIGFESAVSKDCWNLTRSILAENSPYFEAGAKVTYTTDDSKWLISVLALNGWQRITRVNGNSLISWGTQVQYKPAANVLLNYSTFIGTDKPDSARLSRFFHNIYGQFNIGKQWAITTGFDIGTEEIAKGSDKKNTWYAPVMIVKCALSDKWTIAGRLEHYHDTHSVIVATGTPNGFQVTGYSLNFDYAPAKNMLVRLEWRSMKSKDPIFPKRNTITDQNSCITSSIAIAF